MVLWMYNLNYTLYAVYEIKNNGELHGEVSVKIIINAYLQRRKCKLEKTNSQGYNGYFCSLLIIHAILSNCEILQWSLIISQTSW